MAVTGCALSFALDFCWEVQSWLFMPLQLDEFSWERRCPCRGWQVGWSVATPHDGRPAGRRDLYTATPWCDLRSAPLRSSDYKYPRQRWARTHLVSEHQAGGLNGGRASFPCPSRSLVRSTPESGVAAAPMAPPRVPHVGALLLLLAVALASAAPAPRLRGSVACLDCAAGHDLSGTHVHWLSGLAYPLSRQPARPTYGAWESERTWHAHARPCLQSCAWCNTGVVVAVKCAGDGGAGIHAAQTDGRGNFDVAMPGAPASASPCAARVLGATEQLCAPQRLTVARVVPAAVAPGSATTTSSSYVLGSRLAFFTRCAAASGSSAVATMTMAADDRDHQGNAPPEPELRPMPPVVQTPVRPPPFAGFGGNSPPFGFGGLPLIFFPFIPIIGIPWTWTLSPYPKYY